MKKDLLHIKGVFLVEDVCPRRFWTHKYAVFKVKAQLCLAAHRRAVAQWHRATTMELTALSQPAQHS